MKKDLLKFPFKRTFFSTVILCSLSVIFNSCNDDGEGRIKLNDQAPAKVTNVTTESGPGEVYLTWTNPTDESFMYTKIEYTNTKGVKKYKLISKEKANDSGIAQTTISGFGNTNAVSFSLFSCSVRGNNEGAVEVSASPQTPAFVDVAKTITLTPDLGGIYVNWKNIYNTPVYIVLNYYAASDSKKAGTFKFQINGNSESKQFVQLSYGKDDFLSGEECIVNVTTEDTDENASEPIEFKITPIAVVKISKANWSFPGYNDSSNAGTIGYSSQETIGEGGGKSPAGRVIAMLDDNLETYWHASWKQASNYPHWFIVDMGKNVTISSIELIRRQGDARGQKGQIFYTCSDEDAVNKDNPDSWAWTNHGAFTFDPGIDVPQVYRINSNPVARYIKVYFGTEHKGTGAQAMVSEINVYGAE